MDRRSVPKSSKSLQSLQNGLHIHKTQHSVNYVVYEERTHNKSSSRTDLFRKHSTSFRVSLRRTVCGSVCVLSELVFKNIHAYTKRRVLRDVSRYSFDHVLSTYISRMRYSATALCDCTQNKTRGFESLHWVAFLNPLFANGSIYLKLF